MDTVNQTQGFTQDGMSQDSGQQMQQPAAGQGQMGGAEPQAGGYYQYVPGAGFVQVQGAAQQDASAQAGVQQSAYAQQGTQADAAAQADAAFQAGMAQGMAQGAAQATAQATADATAQAGMLGQQAPEGTEPKFDQEKLGKVYGAVSDIMNGEADASTVFGLFQDTGGDFWKGAIVGAAAVFLLNNDQVKGAVAGVVGSMFGDKDPEGEQVTLDD